MKASKKIRVLRALAIAGSLSAFVPGAAMARLPVDPINPPVSQSGGVTAPYELPSGYHPEVQTTAHQFTLPSRFQTEVQRQSRPAQQPFTLPASFKPEVQSPSSPASASNPSSIVREIRTVTEDGNRTLAIVLAAIALAIALCGSAYAWVRLTRMQRDLQARSGALAS